MGINITNNANQTNDELLSILQEIGTVELETTAQTVKEAINEINNSTVEALGINDSTVSTSAVWSSDKLYRALAAIPKDNLKCWYKAEDITGVADGGYIKTWPDASGNGLNMTSSADKTDPILRLYQVNGLPLVEFSPTGGHGDGSPYATCLNNTTSKDYIDGTSGLTLFFVGKLASDYNPLGGSTQTVLYASTNSATTTRFRAVLQTTIKAYARRVAGEAMPEVVNPVAGLHRSLIGELALYEIVVGFANQTLTTYINGRLIGTVTLTSAGVASTTGTQIALGCVPTLTAYALDGSLGEVMLYNTIITDNHKECVRDYLFDKWGIERLDSRFVCEYETANNQIDTPVANLTNLSLIAAKRRNDYGAAKAVTIPDTIGYLYLDEVAQKLYYSSGRYNNPKYLCDWNSTLSGGTGCQTYVSTITKDGDIIFLKRLTRSNPIIYPAGNYSNPAVINFGATTPPCGFLMDSGIDFNYTTDSFVFGEYFNPITAGQDVSIWKVTKPYATVGNWVRVAVYTQNEGTPGGNPTMEIRHFHAIDFDFVSGIWYACTGDYDYQCRILKSEDGGDTWTEVISDGQEYRSTGLVFTEDYGFYASDTTGIEHVLYRIPRVAGVLDFANMVRLCHLPLLQPTYTICILRSPFGILMLDRAETRTDYVLDLLFWSFDYNRLYRLDIVDVMDGVTGETDGRFGFGNQVVTSYQPTSEDGIICGSASLERPLNVAVLNNTEDYRLGNVKIKVRQVY